MSDKPTATIQRAKLPDQPILYEPLLGEREFFEALHGGPGAHALWCFEVMFGSGDQTDFLSD